MVSLSFLTDNLPSSFSWLWNDEEDVDEVFTICAKPGLVTFLDAALYQRFEGEISPTVITAHNLLEAFISLKNQSIQVLKRQLQQQKQANLTTDAFCRSCLDVAYEAIEKITTDPFAQSANFPCNEDALGGHQKSYADSLISASAETGRRHGLSACQNYDGYWESERLYCPDYVWADTAAQHCQRLLRQLIKLKDTTSSTNSTGLHDDDHLKRLFLIISNDIPARLTQFRAAMEANAVVIKRLHVVKCEYRNPFRSYLEAHVSLQRAPSAELVREYKSLPAFKVEHRREECKTRLQKLLHTEALVEALTLAQKIEEFENLMAKSLYSFSELARFLDHKKGWIRADVIESREQQYQLQETLRRLKTILCRKAGPGVSTGIRPILLDLQDVPRDDIMLKMSPWVTTTVKGFVQGLSTIASICNRRHSFRAERRADFEIPVSIVQGCRNFDEEMFRFQFEDWLAMVERQHELAKTNDFGSLSEKIRRAEMQVSLAMATAPSLSVVLQRLDVISADKEKLWTVLQEVLVDVCRREMNLKVSVTALSKQDELVYKIPQSTNLGIFDMALSVDKIHLPP